jgi:LacI family transcriptional regulator
MLIQRQVDGVLLVPAGSASDSLRLLRSHKLPFVILDRRMRSQADEVRCDSEAGAYSVVRHLLDLGHRQIAMITGRKVISTSADRVAGYRRALVEAGIEPDKRLILYGAFNYREFNQTDGYQMAQQVLAVTPRPTAIFAANNFIAFGAIRALREIGLRVPEDLSVVAFDDLPSEWVLDPFLTVVAQPAYEIGRLAAELLLERLADPQPAEPRAIILPTELRVRRSSGPPPVEGSLME